MKFRYTKRCGLCGRELKHFNKKRAHQYCTRCWIANGNSFERLERLRQEREQHGLH